MSSTDVPPEGPPVADDALPPVQAPTTESVIQQFLIPLMIVGFIFGVLFFLRWLFHVDNDPHALVAELRRMNSDSWRKAYALSNLLRSPDNDKLKDDHELCRELSDILREQIEAGGTQTEQVRFRVFLCRAVGEFRVTEGLPVLIEAIGKQGQPAELDVRYAAIEALSVLAENAGPESVRNQSPAVDILIEATAETNTQEPAGRRGELCSTAAYALGVIGGSKALDRLAYLVNDVRPNIRYNAGTGLARHGDQRAINVLIEMLDPDNPNALKGETNDSAKAAKRAMVLSTGVRATLALCEQNPEAKTPPLIKALVQLNASTDLPDRVRLDAKEALLRLQKS